MTTLSNQKLKHPASLWLISLTYATVLFSYASILSLIVMYSIQEFNYTTREAYAIFAAFNSLIFTAPLVGGLITSRFGHKQTGMMGLLICAIGMIFVSIPVLWIFFLGLAIYIVGYGLSTPAFFCLAGFIYAKDDPRRDSGHTLFYLLFNTGALFAIIIGGYLATYVSYRFAFMLTASVQLLGFFLMLYLQRYIKAYPGRSFESALGFSHLKTLALLSLVSLLFIPIVFPLISVPLFDTIIMWSLVFIAIIAILIFAYRQSSKIIKLRIYAFLALALISVVFWSLYMLESSLLTVFIKKLVNREVLGFMIPATAFFSLDALGLIIFGLFFSWLWRFLSHRNKDLSIPLKFSLALVSAGFGFIIFTLGIHLSSGNHLVSAWWIIFGYIFLTTGELLLGPIGIAMVGRLTPHGKEGAFMGVWTLMIGISAVISSYLSDLTTVKPSHIISEEKLIYGHTFFLIGIVAMLIGAGLIFLVPTIKRLINHSD